MGVAGDDCSADTGGMSAEAVAMAIETLHEAKCSVMSKKKKVLGF